MEVCGGGVWQWRCAVVVFGSGGVRWWCLAVEVCGGGVWHIVAAFTMHVDTCLYYTFFVGLCSLLFGF